MKSIVERPGGRPRIYSRRGHGKPIGPADNIAMLRRMLRASYRHLDVTDLAGLAQLFGLQADLADLVLHVIGHMKNAGYTWQEIADVTGVTRQAALLRWAPKLAELAAKQ